MWRIWRGSRLLMVLPGAVRRGDTQAEREVAVDRVEHAEVVEQLSSQAREVRKVDE